jgi:hypothetical protein
MFPLITLTRRALGIFWTAAALWLLPCALLADTPPRVRDAALSAVAIPLRDAGIAYRAVAGLETALAGRGSGPGFPSRGSVLAPASRGQARHPEPKSLQVLPLPAALASEAPIAVPDRWRVVELLGLVHEDPLNPYEQNTLKGDRPIYGEWFLNVGLESRSVYERGRVPASADLGRGEITASLGLTRGNTVFRPPDWQLRVSTTLSYAGAASLDARTGREREPDERGRSDRHAALRELFVEKHLRTRSESYDFSSVRIGVQPFIGDFRGFLYRDDSVPALRLFGNAESNRFQYNLAWLLPLEKDAVSALNEFRLRRDSVLVANLYQQDFLLPGFQLQGTAAYDRDREAGVRDVVYAGLSGDGHIERVNLTFSAYTASGNERTGDIERDILAFFAAAEASIDVDWYRLKLYALFATGDPDPSDDRAEGFDSIRERAQFGGLDAGFFQRESIALPGGVILSARDALLPSLRTADDEERANFVNPGLRLLGVGADFDLLPELRLSLNASYLDFDETASVASLRRGAERIPRHIGEDYSLALTYRPLFTQNVVVRFSTAALASGRGLTALLDDGRSLLHSTRVEVVLRY